MDTTESIPALAGSETLPPDNTAPTLRKVMWAKGVSYNAQLHGDYGTTCHLTTGPALGKLTGKTLCGRPFPYDKGHPAGWRMCKRCLAKMRTDYPWADLKTLEFVP